MQTPLIRTHRAGFRRGVAVTALSVLAALALVACSGDDGSSGTSSEDTATTAEVSAAARTIGEDAVVDLGISADEGRCLGNELVEQLGEDEALALNESDADFADLPEAQLTALQVAFNECVPGSALAGDLTGEFYSSIGASTEPDQAVVDCVAAELDGRTGDVALEGLSADGPDADLTATAAILEGCIPDEVVTELFTTSFASSGLSPEQAQCAAEQVSGRISLSQLVEIGSSTGGLPPEIQSISEQAVTACV